jgi:hypothetical protein
MLEHNLIHITNLSFKRQYFYKLKFPYFVQLVGQLSICNFLYWKYCCRFWGGFLLRDEHHARENTKRANFSLICAFIGIMDNISTAAKIVVYHIDVLYAGMLLSVT